MSMNSTPASLADVLAAAADAAASRRASSAAQLADAAAQEKLEQLRRSRRDVAARHCLDALFIAAQSERGRVGFAHDLLLCGSLCTTTRREEVLWRSLVSLPVLRKSGTWLMHAAMTGDLARARFLLKCGAPINAVNSDGSTALLFAACYGRLSVAKLLIENHANVNTPNKSGWTPLHDVCGTYIGTKSTDNERKALLKVLIAAGAHLNVRVNNDALHAGSTPLHIAAIGGLYTLFSILCRAGACKSSTNCTGHTAEQCKRTSTLRESAEGKSMREIFALQRKGSATRSYYYDAKKRH